MRGFLVDNSEVLMHASVVPIYSYQALMLIKIVFNVNSNFQLNHEERQ